MAGAPVLYNALGPIPRPAPAPPAAVPPRVDVAVVGGGVIGLSVGWRLAARGIRTVVFEAGTAGGGTSAAATGMLAAGAEHEPGGDALLALALESLGLWPAFRDALEADAEASIDYRQEGTLVVAVGRDEVERLRARHALGARAGLDARWLAPSAVLDREPGLRSNVGGGIYCPGDHQVDPRLAVAALRAAFLRRGGLLVEGAAVERLDAAGGAVSGVVAGGEVCRASTTVVAGGAAAGALLPEGVSLPLRPLKGQSVAMRMRPLLGRTPPLPIDHVVWTAEVHIAPKRDGRMIVGATVEEAGFDPSITAGGLYALLEGVRRVLPGVEEMAVEGAWAGFRPTTEDDAPALGACPVPGLAFAAGHHRNGYLLAPVTARAIEDLVTGGAVRGAAARFGVGRFGRQAGV